MSAPVAPLPRSGGGGGSRALEQQLVRAFPALSRSSAQRAVKNALGRQRVQPDLDVFAFAVADLRRRARLDGVPLFNAFGFADPTPHVALHRLETAGVAR